MVSDVRDTTLGFVRRMELPWTEMWAAPTRLPGGNGCIEISLGHPETLSRDLDPLQPYQAVEWSIEGRHYSARITEVRENWIRAIAPTITPRSPIPTGTLVRPKQYFRAVSGWEGETSVLLYFPDMRTAMALAL